MSLSLYLNLTALFLLIAFFSYFYLWYPLLILISIHNGIGFKRSLKLWLKSDHKKWLKSSYFPITLAGIFLNYLLYYLLFTYVTKDSYIFYILLFGIGAIISAVLGSLIHSTLGYLTGFYGTGIALIMYGILPSSSLTIINSSFFYLAVVMLSIYSGLLAGRLSKGVINYGFTISTIDFHFGSISPHSLETEILAVGKETFSKPWFDKVEPSKTYGSISTNDVIIFENGIESGVFGNSLTGIGEFSFRVELRNRIQPLYLNFKKAINKEKPIGRILLKIPIDDIESKDFVYIGNKYYEIVDKETLDKKIKIKSKDIFSNTSDLIEEEIDKNKLVLACVKSLPEIMDNYLNTFAWISSDILVKINFVKKSISLVMLTDERTSTKNFVTPYSFQRAYEIHNVLLEKLNKFKDVKDIHGNGPIRIYRKVKENYLNNLDFEANYLNYLDFTSTGLNDDKINLIKSIPASYFSISSFDKLRKKILAKVTFAAISSIVTTTVGMGLKILLS